MQDYASIFISISCPTLEEARKHCEYLVDNDLCGTAKINKETILFSKGENGVESDDVFLMTLKSTPENLMTIQKYIMENHSWGTPCVEVVPVVGDYC